MKKTRFQIRPSVYYLFALALFVLLTPLPGAEYGWLLISILLYSLLKNKGFIKDFDLVKDTLGILLFTFVVGVGATILGYLSLAKIGW